MTGWTDVLIEVVGTEPTNDAVIFKLTFGIPETIVFIHGINNLLNEIGEIYGISNFIVYTKG